MLKFLFHLFRPIPPVHTVHSVLAQIQRDLQTGRVQKVNGEWVVLPEPKHQPREQPKPMQTA